MTYSMIFEKRFSDSEYINGLQTWQQVTAKLRNGLPQDTIAVRIYKYSSDYKTLGSCNVTMTNIVRVANSLRDKQVF